MVNVDNIPQELKNAKRWLLWKYEEQKGKRKKVPYNVRGCRADVTNPAGFATYDEVLAVFTTGGYDGIGFALEDEYAGIDLDNSIDEDGNLKQWARGLLKLLPPTYTEVSPSAKGIKLFFRGGGGYNRHKGSIEIYSSNHYFTITGNKISDTPNVLAEIPSDVVENFLNNLDLVALAADIEKGKYGEDLQKLFCGVWNAYPSQSEADLAFLNMLVLRCNLKNPKDLDFMMRLSGLYRAKWLERHTADGKTYAALTIEKALKSAQAREIPDAIEEFLGAIVPADKWLDVENPEALWDGILYRGAVHLLAGAPKKGESRFIHDLLGVLTALPQVLVLKHADSEIVIHNGKYWGIPHQVYLKALVITEESPATWKNRSIPLGDVSFMPAAQAKAFGLDTLAAVIRRNIFDLIIIDTFDKFAGWEDENDNAKIIQVMEPLVAATHQSRTALLLTHHFRKSGGEGGEEIRGGSALLGSVDVYIAFRGVKGDTRKRTLEILSRFDTVEKPPVATLENLRGGMYSVEATTGVGGSNRQQAAPTQERVLDFLGICESATTEEVAQHLEISVEAARSALKRLASKGLVQKTADKWSRT